MVRGGLFVASAFAVACGAAALAWCAVREDGTGATDGAATSSPPSKSRSGAEPPSRAEPEAPPGRSLVRRARATQSPDPEPDCVPRRRTALVEVEEVEEPVEPVRDRVEAAPPEVRAESERRSLVRRWREWRATKLSAPPSDGVLEFADAEGRTIDRREWRAGKASGDWIVLDDDAQRWSEIAYIDGAQHGLAVHRRADGTVREQGRHENGQFAGTWETFWPNGQRHGERRYEDGVLHGVVRSWREDGSLIQESIYSQGLDVAPCRGYHANGREWFVMPYVNGRRHGEATWWRPDGTVEATATYEDGMIHGVFRAFHPDGSVRGEERWEHNRRVSFEGSTRLEREPPEQDPALGRTPQ